MNHKISPSLLSADFTNLGRDIEIVNDSEADWFHLDVMDGIFVPNISFGQPVISKIKQISKKPLDVHLMITDPDRYIKEFKDCGADILTVHYEACQHLHRTINRIKDLGMVAGVALNPHTSISLLENIIKDLDLIMIMSVNPGFGGQTFIENTHNKVSQLREMIIRCGTNCLIEVDGGINLENAKELIHSGADILVAGKTVFGSKKPLETINELKNLI